MGPKFPVHLSCYQCKYTLSKSVTIVYILITFRHMICKAWQLDPHILECPCSCIITRQARLHARTVPSSICHYRLNYLDLLCFQLKANIRHRLVNVVSYVHIFRSTWHLIPAINQLTLLSCLIQDLHIYIRSVMYSICCNQWVTLSYKHE